MGITKEEAYKRKNEYRRNRYKNDSEYRDKLILQSKSERSEKFKDERRYKRLKWEFGITVEEY